MIDLTHVGERLIAAMFNEAPAVRQHLGTKLGKTLAGYTAHPEAPLQPFGGLSFDGQSRVDVALSDGVASCIACEAKLGTSRMTKRAFEERFLQPCNTSHKGQRISGKIPAVLERKLPGAGAGADLCVQLKPETPLVVAKQWVLVVRRAVFRGWENGKTPNLSTDCVVVTIEDLAKAYGSPSEFNDLVRRLLTFDYHAAWLTE